MNPKKAPEMATVPEEQSVFMSWGKKTQEMSEKQMDMYKRFCEDREKKRLEELEEDIKIRDLFLEAGRKSLSEAAETHSTDKNENIKNSEDSR